MCLTLLLGGGPARLGDAVYTFVVDTLRNRERVLGDMKISHEVSVFDPIEVFGENGALSGSGGHLQHPNFFFGDGKAPAEMDRMRDTIKDADCYLIITPEYNHSVPPALSSMLGHLGDPTTL